MSEHTVLPYLTTETAERIEASASAFWTERLEALRALPNNPYGAHVRQFGKATALLTTGAQNNDLFNRVGNMSTADLPVLDEIVSWYRAQDVRCRFDISPFQGQDALFRRLAAHGFYQSGARAVLYGLPHTDIIVPARIQVRIVRPQESHLFAELYLAASGLSGAPDLSALRESARQLPGRPGLHCFLATVDTVLAGMAILHIYQQVAYLATAAVLPAFRGHGCHKALLHARLTVARIEECSLVVGCAAIGSVGQQNMEKVGLRMAYTRAVWTEY